MIDQAVAVLVVLVFAVALFGGMIVTWLYLIRGTLLDIRNELRRR